MVDKLKEIMDLHRRFAGCIGRKEKNVPLAKKILEAELDAFNEMYFCGNAIRLNMVAAIMEQYLEALKAQGVYDSGLVSNTRMLMASAFIPGGGGRMSCGGEERSE